MWGWALTEDNLSWQSPPSFLFKMRSLVYYCIQGFPVFAPNGSIETQTCGVGFYMGPGNFNSGSYIYLANVLLSGPSPQSIFYLKLMRVSGFFKFSYLPLGLWTSTAASPSSLSEQNNFQLQLGLQDVKGSRVSNIPQKVPTKMLQNTEQQEHPVCQNTSSLHINWLINKQTTINKQKRKKNPRLVQSTWRLILMKGEKSGL